MTRDRWESHCKEIFLHKASVAHGHLKPMDFQLVVFGQSNLDEELADVLALVALQLNHFSILRVLDHSTIAGKFLLERLHQFLFIVIIRDALDSGEGLPAVPLLDPYMDVVLSAGRKQVITLTCISKGVEGLEVLDSGHTIRFPSLGEAAAASGGGGGGAGRAGLGRAGQVFRMNLEKLSKPELLTLFSILEGELEARDLVIEALKAQHRDTFIEERYGKYNISDPLMALQRDFEALKEANHGEKQPVCSNPLSILKVVMKHCKNMQERMLSQLAAAESRHRKVCFASNKLCRG